MASDHASNDDELRATPPPDAGTAARNWAAQRPPTVVEIEHSLVLGLCHDAAVRGTTVAVWFIIVQDRVDQLIGHDHIEKVGDKLIEFAR